MKTTTEIPTIEKLNKTDDPKRYQGQCDGDDGQGNQLWSFPEISRVANRYDDGDGGVFWDNDIEGWNYTKDFALNDD